MKYDRVDSGYRVDMVAGLIVLGTVTVVVAAVVARASNIRSGVRCSWGSGEEK